MRCEALGFLRCGCLSSNRQTLKSSALHTEQNIVYENKYSPVHSKPLSYSTVEDPPERCFCMYHMQGS